MRALILSAGYGTRLRPWTLSHPKALVPVRGVPMLERVLSKLENEGFNRIVINVHHFGEQIIDYIKQRDNKSEILISDEREQLLDTGGGILQADEVLKGDSPLLVHNVDILSNAPLAHLWNIHINSNADATLLTSQRTSTRLLAFDKSDRLYAWINQKTGEIRPNPDYKRGSMLEEAFSGIYIINKSMIDKMRYSHQSPSFPIMDFLLSHCREYVFKHYFMPSLRLIDIGKPETLSYAQEFLSEL